MTNVKEKTTELEITAKLHTMLNNHPERPKSILNAFVLDKRKVVEEEASFEIFSFNPEKDIEKKVKNMRRDSRWRTLNILDLKKVADEEYTVILGINR